MRYIPRYRAAPCKVLDIPNKSDLWMTLGLRVGGWPREEDNKLIDLIKCSGRLQGKNVQQTLVPASQMLGLAPFCIIFK